MQPQRFVKAVTPTAPLTNACNACRIALLLLVLCQRPLQCICLRRIVYVQKIIVRLFLFKLEGWCKINFNKNENL